MINETPVISLGHNYTHSILKHNYLGSEKVVKDLKSLQGFNEGLVELDLSREGFNSEKTCLVSNKLSNVNLKSIIN